MIYSTDKEYRWDLFEHYAARLVSQHPDWALTQREYADFTYLKHYFAEDYIKAKMRPWLPSIFDKAKKKKKKK